MTGLQTPFERAARALYGRMITVFSADGLALYEDAPKRPDVSFGTPSVVKPFAVWVDMLPFGVRSTGSATTHEVAVEFAIDVYCVTKHSNRDVAVNTLQKYVNSIYMGVSADATLGRSVNNAIPRISDAGVDVTAEKQYIAAAVVEVTCKVASVCPKEFRELVKR